MSFSLFIVLSGYGDLLYDMESGQYVAFLYHGTNTEAVLKQYRFRLEREGT